MSLPSILRVRLDRINSGHAHLTFFQSDDGHNYASTGTVVVSRRWFDNSPLRGLREGAKADLEVRHPIQMVEDEVLVAVRRDIAEDFVSGTDSEHHSAERKLRFILKERLKDA